MSLMAGVEVCHGCHGMRRKAGRNEIGKNRSGVKMGEEKLEEEDKEGGGLLAAEQGKGRGR